MGVVCSQNIRRLKKHVIAPEDNINVNRSAKSSTITHGFGATAAAAPAVAQPKQVFQNSTIACHTPNKSPQILVVKPSTPSTPSSSSRQTISTSSYIATQSISDQLLKHSSADSSSIDENSILCRSNELNNSKIFKRSLSVDSSNSPKLLTKNKSNQIHKLFKSNQNLLNDHNVSTVGTQTTKEQKNLTKLYRKFGGSVQTLFNPNSHSNNRNKKSKFSVSETNLSALKVESSGDERKRISATTSNTTEYCPSVLFNRISNKRRSSSDKEPDKNLTFTKWKNYFINNVLRKRKDLNSRKT